MSPDVNEEELEIVDPATPEDVSAESSSEDSVNSDSQPEEDALLDVLNSFELDDSEDPEQPEEQEAEAEAEADEEVEETTEEQDSVDSEPEAAESEVIEDGETEGSEDADVLADGDLASEKLIPFERFQEINNERKSYEGDAKAMRELRDFYREANIGDDEFKQFVSFAAALNTNPDSVKDRVRAMAEAVGFQVADKDHAEIDRMVQDGDVSEEAAERLRERVSSAPTSNYEIPEAPSVAERGYSIDDAKADALEVWNGYQSKLGDKWTEDMSNEVGSELKRIVAEATELTGREPAPEKLAHLTAKACQNVVKKHTQPVKKPKNEPIRVSRKARSPRKVTADNLEDFIDSDPSFDF